MNNKLPQTLLGLIIIAGMTVAPTKCIESGYNSLKLCATALIPTLLPFFICVKLLMKTGFASKIGKPLERIMRPAFNLPGEAAFAFVMGIISGYPMGAKCATQLLDNKICTKKEAERIVCFCNNSGPLFLIGSVGVVMLGNKTAGIILFVSHLLSAITVGIIISFNRKAEALSLKTKMDNTNGTLAEAVTEAVNLMLYVCGYVVFFNILSTVLESFGIFDIICYPFTLLNIDKGLMKALISGIVEMTGGISKLSALFTGNLKLPLISFLTGFGGISVIVQVIGVTEQYNLSRLKFVIAKLTQGLISFIYTCLLLKLPIAVNTAVFLRHSFSLTGSFICGILLVFVSVTVMYAASTIIRIISWIYRNGQS